jgi:hypothetical protein
MSSGAAGSRTTGGRSGRWLPAAAPRAGHHQPFLRATHRYFSRPSSPRATVAPPGLSRRRGTRSTSGAPLLGRPPPGAPAWPAAGWHPSSAGWSTRRRTGAAGRRGCYGSVPLSRRAGAPSRGWHRSDWGGVEEARGSGGHRGRTAVGGGGVGEEVGGGAAGVGAVMGNGDGAEVGWALDVSLGNRRRAGGAFGSVVQ